MSKKAELRAASEEREAARRITYRRIVMLNNVAQSLSETDDVAGFIIYLLEALEAEMEGKREQFEYVVNILDAAIEEHRKTGLW